MVTYLGSNVFWASKPRSSGYFLITRGRWSLGIPKSMRKSSFLLRVLSTLAANISGQRHKILPVVLPSRPISSIKHITYESKKNFRMMTTKRNVTIYRHVSKSNAIGQKLSYINDDYVIKLKSFPQDLLLKSKEQ